MKFLTVDNHKKLAIIDDEDFDRLKIYSYFSSGHYRRVSLSRLDSKTMKHISLACDVMNVRNVIFDHKDRDPFNNQKYNLRVATLHQNLFNRNKPLTFTSTSKFKGVHWNKNCRKWHAQIMLNGKNIYLGLHLVEEDAAKAYDKKAAELFGEFACLNFPLITI